MSRKGCWACRALRSGVKSRKPFNHTCGLEPGVHPDRDRLSIDDTPDEHKWQELPATEDQRQEWTIGFFGHRNFKCTLCPCTKESSFFKVHGKTYPYVKYERSGILYSQSPACWGGPNPL